jgi:replication factor A2
VFVLLNVYKGMDFQGGGGGGGYSNYGGGGGASQNSGGGDKRNSRAYDEQTVIPVSIQMANKATLDPSNVEKSALLLQDGRPLHTVCLVGAVRSVEDQSTNVLYTIEDGTGTMDVKQWLDDNDSSMMLQMRKETTKEGIYVKVLGEIKDYEGKKLVVARSVRPLSTGNELTHHLLEVIYSGETFQRADSIIAPQSSMMGVGTMNHLGSNSGGMKMMMGHNPTNSFEGLKDRIYATMRDNDNGSEEGISIEQTIQLLPDVQQVEIRKIVTILSEEGQIYSTVSENHYKVAM